MGKLEGRVAIITGGARGQGRSHALAAAREGADIVVCDIAAPIRGLQYVAATDADLAETVRLVEDLDRRCVGVKADVRDPVQVQRVVDAAISEFGKIDILMSNAGVTYYYEIMDTTDQVWQDTIDINLTGSFNVTRAVLPHMIERQYGRIVYTSSGVARMGIPTLGPYVASKWGVLGLMKSVAMEVAHDGITVNAVLPATVNTPMIQHEALYRLFRPDLENPTAEDAIPALSEFNLQGVPWVETEDITYAVMCLVTEEARYMTGGGIDVGAGATAVTSS
jgi:SDR family mycofactocin-dependent oxidoreductase